MALCVTPSGTRSARRLPIPRRLFHDDLRSGATASERGQAQGGERPEVQHDDHQEQPVVVFGIDRPRPQQFPQQLAKHGEVSVGTDGQKLGNALQDAQQDRFHVQGHVSCRPAGANLHKTNGPAAQGVTHADQTLAEIPGGLVAARLAAEIGRAHV